MTIEQRALKHYGTTDVFEFAGYLLKNGEMLNFSDGGLQRDQDHRNIGFFFSTSSGTEAMLKFMRRGNIRVMCDGCGFRFEYITKPSTKQLQKMSQAYYLARRAGIEFVVEKDNADGTVISKKNVALKLFDEYEEC